MKFKILDTVVLARDLPAHGLKKDDLGTIVELYEPDGLEVEFLMASGRTKVLATLNTGDVRSVGDTDLMSVRPLRTA